MRKKVLITFAGAVGSSKTPIAYYLSWSLGLPILNNDAMRTEVMENLGFFDEDVYIKVRNERIYSALQSGRSLIYDASVDREWDKWKDKISEAGYDVFIISLDLSRDFLTELYKIKGYHESLNRIEDLLKDHDNFLDKYSKEVGCRILDENFKDRLSIALKSVIEWM